MRPYGAVVRAVNTLTGRFRFTPEMAQARMVFSWSSSDRYVCMDLENDLPL